MAKITTLFIDKGGVLIDTTALSPQYRRLLGEFLPTELGGSLMRGRTRMWVRPIGPSSATERVEVEPGVLPRDPCRHQDPSATALVIDDSERAIHWAGECGLRGVLVRRETGEQFESSVLRAFDEVDARL